MCPHLTVVPSPDDPFALALTGEIDLDTAPLVVDELGRKLTVPPGARVRVSCAGLEFVDMIGLHALWQATRLAADRGIVVELVEPSRPLRLLLDLVGDGANGDGTA